jgi:hypothetical protein
MLRGYLERHGRCPLPLTRLRTDRICLGPHARPAVDCISRGRASNAGTVQRVLNCGERAGDADPSTRYPASTYFVAYHYYAIGEIVAIRPLCRRDASFATRVTAAVALRILQRLRGIQAGLPPVVSTHWAWNLWHCAAASSALRSAVPWCNARPVAREGLNKEAGGPDSLHCNSANGVLYRWRCNGGRKRRSAPLLPRSPDHFDRRSKEVKTRRLVSQLASLGITSKSAPSPTPFERAARPPTGQCRTTAVSALEN